MNIEELEKIAVNVRLAQETEFHAKIGLDISEQELEKIKTEILVTAHSVEETFNGLKVAQIVQKEQYIINTSQAVKNGAESVSKALEVYESAKRNRMFHENMLSLTKAWLYSQRGIE